MRRGYLAKRDSASYIRHLFHPQLIPPALPLQYMKTLLLSFITLLGGYQVKAQAIPPSDSSQLNSAVRAASRHYQHNAPESRLLNGVAYINHAPSYVTGRPFFQSSDPQSGTLVYDGQQFVDVPLLYEQVQDQVLLDGPAQAQPLQLIRQQVQAFEVGGHRFVHLPADSAGVVAEGFYDLVADGPAQLLVKRSKKVEAATGGYNITGKYEEKTQFFVQRQGKIYELNTLKQALGALADKKAEMQAYARRYRLRFLSDSREASLTALVKEYNSLVSL